MDHQYDQCGRSPDGSAASADDALRWYLIHCKPHQDERALEHLQRQGFECFRPVRYVERYRQGRKYTAAEPLFPRYLFIHLDSSNDNWYPIRSTRGINSIVRFNEHPLPVRDEIIEEIRARLRNPQRPDPYLTPGEAVRITEGAFAQLEGIFIANDDNERVLLLLNILHKDHQLSFPLRSVKKLG